MKGIPTSALAKGLESVLTSAIAHRHGKHSVSAIPKEAE